jgi:hypothetical protein
LIGGQSVLDIGGLKYLVVSETRVEGISGVRVTIEDIVSCEQVVDVAQSGSSSKY